MAGATRWIIREKQNIVLETDPADYVAPGPREIIVRVDFTAISAGTEGANYQALDPNVYKPGAWCCYPWQPGYAGVGRVIARGADVKEYAIGDRVVGVMRHGSHWRTPVDDYITKARDDVPAEQLPFVRFLSICHTAAEVLTSDPLGVAGVWGQGMIGNMTAQILQRAGFRVIVIDPLPARREVSGKCGLKESLDPSDAGFADKIKELTGGRGFDVAVDAIGHAPTTITLPTFLRHAGQLVIMTHWRSQEVVDASPLISGIFTKNLQVHGALETGRHYENQSNWLSIQRRKMDRLQREMASGTIQIAPLISHVIRPNQCREAFEGLCFDRANWTGVTVDWRGG